jgi:hypothetical protein
MNDLVRYPFGTISKSFYSALPLLFVYIFSSPLPFDTYKEQRTEKAKRQKYWRGSIKAKEFVRSTGAFL